MRVSGLFGHGNRPEPANIKREYHQGRVKNPPDEIKDR